MSVVISHITHTAMFVLLACVIVDQQHGRVIINGWKTAKQQTK